MGYFPPALKSGDTIMVVAPTGGAACVAEATAAHAIQTLKELDINVKFSKHYKEEFLFSQDSIEKRVQDIHDAFSDPDVHGIFSIIGGMNSNQLLGKIDYELIKRNPKTFCGYSDITALQNAIYKMTGMVTFSGPHFQTLGIKKGNEYTVNMMRKALFERGDIAFLPSLHWSDDPWYLDQENRNFRSSPGTTVINAGSASGILVGGNLSTFQLLCGTHYLPDDQEIVLFAEEDDLVNDEAFDRLLQSVTENYQGKLKALLVGRFQDPSNISPLDVKKFIDVNSHLKSIPVLSGLDFGHTSPMATIPVGARVSINATGDESNIIIHVD